MIITTRNAFTGRGIERARENTHWAFQLDFNNEVRTPTLLARVTGADGKTYTVQLTAKDLAQLDEARVRYAEQLTAKGV